MPDRVALKPIRIRRNGPTGYVVTLPSFWVENEGIGVGDNIVPFVSTEGELIFTKKPEPKELKV